MKLPPPEQKDVDDTLRYIFMGHTYDWQSVNHHVDPRIQEIRFSDYARTWLGGDISSEALLKRSTILHIDSVFDLSAATTQYALGNHDVRNGNMQYYWEATGRKSYNMHSENGVVSICLNTQLNPSLCEDLNNQFDLIKNVCDTIQSSSHLFLFMHSGIFGNVPNLPPSENYAHTNFSYWNANCSGPSATFVSAIYPLLEQVKARGIIVYCILGDTGAVHKQFHAEVADSIHFFANGINNSKYTDPVILAQQEKDRVLIFEHVLPTDEITWKFKDLDSLLLVQ
ncbi:MAG: hypothetical protein MK066_02520 [Crocinitomicaceae bacterium]|nr:hypothetical protein [Crocinitomicaceae bacterium]